MTDGESGQLLHFAGTTDLPTLVVFDENATPLPANPFADAVALTNRSDICHAAQQQGWPCIFSDFAFDTAALAGRRLALYRISKEKRVTEHVLQSLWLLLPAGGVLCIAGYRQEGIKTFAARAGTAWHQKPVLERGHRQLHLYRFTKSGNDAAALNTDDYHALRPIGTWQDRTVYSKPGLFAWDRFDAGSRFLLDHLPHFIGSRDCSALSALDLGCGCGLLAVALLAAGCGSVTATDNNAAALLASTCNLAQHADTQRVAVVAADCGDTLDERFDLILCNPPFHQGFGVEQDLTDRFLRATRRLLRPQGRALFVVNAFIPLERKAAALFPTVRSVADNRSYRLVELAG